MTYRNLLLAACAGTGLLVAFGSIAMPSATFEPNVASAITLVDDDDGDGDGDREGRRHGSEEEDREASYDCGGDDDDDDCSGRGGMQRQQSPTPPANGLFAPGSKPNVQVK